MPSMNENKANQPINKSATAIDGGPIRGRLSSDNAFSESGLENAERLSEAIKKTHH